MTAVGFAKANPRRPQQNAKHFVVAETSRGLFANLFASKIMQENPLDFLHS
jgi:hypothetical protein